MDKIENLIDRLTSDPEATKGAVAQIYATISPILLALRGAPIAVPLTAAQSVSEVKNASAQDLIDLCCDTEGQMAALISQFTAIGYLLATRQAYDAKGMQSNWVENVELVAKQIQRLAVAIRHVTIPPPAADTH